MKTLDATIRRMNLDRARFLLTKGLSFGDIDQIAALRFLHDLAAAKELFDAPHPDCQKCWKCFGRGHRIVASVCPECGQGRADGTEVCDFCGGRGTVCACYVGLLPKAVSAARMEVRRGR